MTIDQEKLKKVNQVHLLNNKYCELQKQLKEFTMRLNKEQFEYKDRLSLQFRDASSSGVDHTYSLSLPDGKAKELSKVIGQFYQEILLEIENEINNLL